MAVKRAREHHRYSEGSRAKTGKPAEPPSGDRDLTENQSWTPDPKGQGGEGLSKGYGGSAGAGTGALGADDDREPDPLGPGNIPGQNPATPERPPGHTKVRGGKR